MFQRAEAIEPMPPQLKINIHFTNTLKRENIKNVFKDARRTQLLNINILACSKTEPS